MKFKEYLLRKIIPTYFMLVTFLVLFIFLCGSILEPEARFGYEALLSPIIYAGIGIIPALLGYSRKELSIRQAVVRKLIQLCGLLALILGFSIAGGVIKNWQGGVAVFAGVILLDVLIQVILWRMEVRTASLLTQALKNLEEEE